MANIVAQIQVLQKADYTKQHLVSIPDAHPSHLAVKSIRIQSRILGLTTNTLTYARLGGQIGGWWETWPMPPSATSIDTSKYCRIFTWGYAEIIDSTHPEISSGQMVFGVMPIGTYPEDLRVELDGETGQIIAQRQGQFSTVNRLFACPPAKSSAEQTTRAWDLVLYPYMMASYALNRYAFAWDDTRRAHPYTQGQPWSADDANLDGAVVVILAASGKSALAFAHQLRQARPADHQPKRIVAVGSASSRAFCEGTGFFDSVLLYEDVQDDQVVKGLAIDKDTKVLLASFGARGNADVEWLEKLKQMAGRITALVVGGNPKADGFGQLRGRAAEPKSGVVTCNAAWLIEIGEFVEGKAQYWNDMTQEWLSFRDNGGVKGMTLKWREGLGDLEKDWDSMCGGEWNPSVGLVYKI